MFCFATRSLIYHPCVCLSIFAGNICSNELQKPESGRSTRIFRSCSSASSVYHGSRAAKFYRFLKKPRQKLYKKINKTTWCRDTMAELNFRNVTVLFAYNCTIQTSNKSNSKGLIFQGMMLLTDLFNCFLTFLWKLQQDFKFIRWQRSDFFAQGQSRTLLAHARSSRICTNYFVFNKRKRWLISFLLTIKEKGIW